MNTQLIILFGLTVVSPAWGAQEKNSHPGTALGQIISDTIGRYQQKYLELEKITHEATTNPLSWQYEYRCTQQQELHELHALLNYAEQYGNSSNGQTTLAILAKDPNADIVRSFIMLLFKPDQPDPEDIFYTERASLRSHIFNLLIDETNLTSKGEALFRIPLHTSSSLEKRKTYYLATLFQLNQWIGRSNEKILLQSKIKELELILAATKETITDIEQAHSCAATIEKVKLHAQNTIRKEQIKNITLVTQYNELVKEYHQVCEQNQYPYIVDE
ncbi:MAG: hypothetical protein WCE21_00875 [Candidatus Babeliales bacterium]